MSIKSGRFKYQVLLSLYLKISIRSANDLNIIRAIPLSFSQAKY